MFNKQEQAQIIEAIKHAELQTSGEIRVHVEPKCKTEPVECAKEIFVKLNMHATELKNGVLFYLAYKDKKFVVIGDSGIHEKVTDAFWDEERDILQSHFKENKFAEGLCLAIQKAGEKLNTYFPRQHNDSNELRDDISFGGAENE